MGMFDSIYVPCPHCGRRMEFQTKAGDCQLKVMTLEQATPVMLLDIRDQPERHRACGNWVVLHDPDWKPPQLRAFKVRAPDKPGSSEDDYKWWPLDVPFTPADIIEGSTVMNTERRLLLEIARALSRLLRDFDRTQFPRDRDWAEHQKHAYRIFYLAADLEHGSDEAGAKIAAMEAAGWKP